ncbi:hypothetical protein HOU03_gp092 [Caulobacter phage CcrSC]|uniref:Uncharacterized protein n=1 Tax=Caulobacter phage CcrSC TaxID=2283272 RepID=A0A385ECR1_9CAUD|nr:hypothetical protein HOU03_gp092 [Caulobacter phage CcrSC]AXQ69674.1 hypothetical protein CcrSC_gp092 [Caulobacter phage CcrSC]
MLASLLEDVIEGTRLRASQGDCPIHDAYSVEWLEDALLTLVDERDALKKQVEDLSFDLSLKKIRIDYLEAVAAFSKPAETAVPFANVRDDLRFNDPVAYDNMNRVQVTAKDAVITITPAPAPPANDTTSPIFQSGCYLSTDTMVSSERDFLGYTGGIVVGEAPDLGLSRGELRHTVTDCAARFASAGPFQGFPGTGDYPVRDLYAVGFCDPVVFTGEPEIPGEEFSEATSNVIAAIERKKQPPLTPEEEADKLAQADAAALEFVKAMMRRELPVERLKTGQPMIPTRPGYGIAVVDTPYGNKSREMRVYRGETRD